MMEYIRNELWENISGIGNLIIEELLVVGEEPVLFSCRLKGALERYLIMTYDSEDSIFVISKIHPYILADMLCDKITMEQAFRSSDEIMMTKMEDDKVVVDRFESEQFDEDLLPRKGECYGLRMNYITRYIEKL